jgi:hypothetical protein
MGLNKALQDSLEGEEKGGVSGKTGELRMEESEDPTVWVPCLQHHEGHPATQAQEIAHDVPFLPHSNSCPSLVDKTTWDERGK